MKYHDVFPAWSRHDVLGILPLEKPRQTRRLAIRGVLVWKHNASEGRSYGRVDVLSPGSRQTAESGRESTASPDRCCITFRRAQKKFDPSLLWYVDVRCSGDQLPRDPQAAREWFLKNARFFVEHLKQVADADTLVPGSTPTTCPTRRKSRTRRWSPGAHRDLGSAEAGGQGSCQRTSQRGRTVDGAVGSPWPPVASVGLRRAKTTPRFMRPHRALAEQLAGQVVRRVGRRREELGGPTHRRARFRTRLPRLWQSSFLQASPQNAT